MSEIIRVTANELEVYNSLVYSAFVRIANTAIPAKDVDILLLMDEAHESERMHILSECYSSFETLERYFNKSIYAESQAFKPLYDQAMFLKSLLDATNFKEKIEEFGGD